MQFNFEKNLSHQINAVKAITGIFEGVEIINANNIDKNFVNPSFDTEANFKFINNV